MKKISELSYTFNAWSLYEGHKGSECVGKMLIIPSCMLADAFSSND